MVWPIVRALVGAASVLAIPWAFVACVVQFDLMANPYIVAQLNDGSSRGRVIDFVLFVFPTFGGSFAAGYWIGTERRHIAAAVLLVSAMSFGSILGLRSATSGWAVPLLPSGGASVARAIQVIELCCIGVLMGWGTRRNGEIRTQKLRESH